MCLTPNENSNFENKNFESLKYSNILNATEYIPWDNSCEPDSAIKNFDATYVMPEELHSQFRDHISDGHSSLHINIRNINKNFISNYSFLPWLLHLV